MCVATAPACSSAALSALLPNTLLDGVKEEKKKRALATLVNSVVCRSAKALEEKLPSEFECTPGDFACESLALALLDALEDPALAKEAQRVEKREEEELTETLQYLLNCHLLKVVRKEGERLRNGIVRTRTVETELKKLSPELTTKECKLIVETAKRRVSRMTMQFMRKQSLLLCDEPLCRVMLSEEQTHCFSFKEKMEPKSVGCLFYKIKTVLERLKQRQELVALRSIAAEEKNRFSLFFRADRGLFRSVQLKREERLSDRLLVVFEAVLAPGLSRKKLRRLFDGKLEEYILASAAMIPQYEKGFATGRIPLKAARLEIRGYKELAKILGCGAFDTEGNQEVIKMDHVFCCRLKELGGGDETA